MRAVLPLASLADALVPAIVGVVGVVVGSVTNWFVQERAERRRREGETRSAKRLVRAELLHALAIIETAVGERRQLSPELATRLETPVWQQFRGPLALSLEEEEWEACREALSSVAALRVALESAAGGPGVQRALDERARIAIKDIRAAQAELEQRP